MISNLFDKNIIKILVFFLISPGSRYTRKEIKENTGMNNVPLDNSLNKLKKFNLTKEEKGLLILNHHPSEPFEIIGLINCIRSEYKNMSLPLKIFYILLEISDKLSEIKNIKEAFLFGSYAKLIYSDKSDIDLAIIFYNKTKNKGRIERKILEKTRKIGKKYKKKIEAHYFLESDMKRKEDPLIKDILKNGKRVL